MESLHGLLIDAAFGLFFIGLAGALTRRSLIVVISALVLSWSGPVLLLAHFARMRQDAQGLAHVVLILLLGVSVVVMSCAVAVAAYRRRGTINLDELRELRG